MSRDLSFWKTDKNTECDNRHIYCSLSNEEYLPFIDEIPIIKIQQDINEVFKAWKNHNNRYYENEREAFELMLTKQFFRADCYNMTNKSMNDIIDVLNKYDCPLYDSAIDVRFDD